MSVTWCSTKLMSADFESRNLNIAEEFMPQVIFEKIEEWLQITVSVDAMASMENKKCQKYFSFRPEIHPDLIDFDIFNTWKKALPFESIFWFPPTKILSRTAALIKNKFMDLPLVVPSSAPFSWELNFTDIRWDWWRQCFSASM